MRAAIRTKHYSGSTEKAYVHWIKRFILFHNKRHPAEMGKPRKLCRVASLRGEVRLGKLVKAAGGKWNRQKRVWELAYREVQAADLEERRNTGVSDRRNIRMLFVYGDICF